MYKILKSTGLYRKLQRRETLAFYLIVCIHITNYKIGVLLIKYMFQVKYAVPVVTYDLL